MAIDLATGFNIGSKDAIDERQVLTLEQMKNLDESIYPDKYFAICKDNGKLYLYNVNNEVDNETGKFRVLEGSGTSDLTGYKKTYTSKSELFVDSNPTSIYDIIVKLEEGEMFLDYTRYYNLDWFPTYEGGAFRIIKGGYEDFSDTTVEWFGASGSYAIAVLNADVGVERWNVLGGTGKSVYSRKITLGTWNLLARIKLSSSDNTKHVLSFSCLNQVPTGVDYVFNKDADLCKYELHFTVPDLTSAYNSIKLTQFGLVLYEYPMPEGTADGLKNLSKNIGLYYDREDLSISIFIINTTNVNYLEGRYIGSKLMNVSLEYTGEGTIVQSLQSNGYTSWGQVSWNEMCAFEDLEYPTIVPIGGDGGSAEGATTYTSLTELGLTATATFQDVVDTLPKGGSAILGVKDFTNYQTIFPYEEGNDQFARVHIIKGVANGSCVYARWFRKDGIKEAIAIFNVNDNKFSGWQLLKNRQTFTSLTELGLTADATVEDVVSTLKNGESFLAPVNTFTNYETIFPNKVPNDQWNKIHIIKGTSLASSHIRCFSPSGACEYLANINNTNIVAWNDVSGTYIDISDAVIEKLGNEILKYPVGKYRINSTTTGNKFTDLPSDAEINCGLIEINGTAVGKSPFTDTWVYRMYKFECLTGTLNYIRRLNSGATAGQVEVDTGWCKDGQEIYTSLTELGLTADATIDDVISTLKDGETAIISTNEFTNYKDGMFPNQCTNDQYAVIKVEKESGSKVFLEWRQKEGNAYAIGGLNGSNKFTNWNNLVRFKKDGFADDSIVCIGNAVSTDGTVQTLESLGFSTDILLWENGVYRVSHFGGLVNLPSVLYTNNNPAFRLEHHNLVKNNVNPNNSTYAPRQSIIYCDNGDIYCRFYKSGATAGTYITDTGWQQIHTKKEDDSYIPDMYDRNANGDIPVVPFDRLANCIAVRTNRGLVSTTETEATYNEDYVGGYVFSGANDILVKDKEMFNKIKVLVHIPGVLRIGIVNDKIYEANPRYSTCLVKWLVADFVAFTGTKEYDIDDTVLEEGQSIFLECRVGVSSWYLNTGEATQVGAITYPASSCTTGLNVADTLDTTTNNALFKSQKVNSSSCLTSFGNNMYSIGGKIRGNFQERAYNNGATSSKETYENTEYFGGLNIGLYRRTKYSDTRFCKCVENAMSPTFPLLSNSVRIWFSTGQEALEGKSVYAIKLDVHTPGNLTICHCKGTTVDDFQIIDKYTHYVRAKGLQTIHLPFDIKLNKGEYIGLGGFHCKSTADNIVVDTCRWHYVSLDEVRTCSWMNTIGKTGFYSLCIDPTQYPEVCTSVSSLNSGCLNVELICRGEKRSPLEDKYISFTGDSITTFAGFCTTKTGYPEGNPAGDNAVYYPASGKVINNVDATWWGILAKDNRMKILRNDAWSGSRVSSTEGSTDTKCLCGTQRRYNLRNGYAFATNSTYPFGRPEIIVSMIGTNDLSGGVELGDEMFKGVTGAEEEYKTILSAFSLFCRRIHDQEGGGGAKIVHFLIPRGSDYGYANANGVTIADLSLHFERIAKAWGQYFIPLSYFNGIKPNAPKRWSCPTGSMFKNTNKIELPSADGLHPNAMGMEAIADGVHRFLCSIM